MTQEARARAVVLGGALAGALALGVTAVLSAGRGVGTGFTFAAFTALLTVMLATPMYLPKGDEVEALELGEAFLVASLLLLQPLGTVLAYGFASTVSAAARRRPFGKSAFNVGQTLAAVAAAAGAAHLVAPHLAPEAASPLACAAAVVGAAVFLLVNSTAVSAAIAFTGQQPLRTVWLDGIGLRLLVWAGSVSIGVLVALGASRHSWGPIFGILPLFVLQAVLRGYGHARMDRHRMDGLFHTAVEAHRTMGVGDVERSLAASAQELLRCRSAQVRSRRPGPGELGAELPDRPGTWLVVSGRRGIVPFEEADQKLLEAIVAVGAAALDNAALYEQVLNERQKATSVVESSSDGIFSVDDEQRIESWNPAMERITGFVAADVVGSKCFTVFRPRDAEGRELCVAACPGRCGQHFETVPVQVTTIGGEQRWLDCTYSPMAEGGYVVVARDITTQKQVDDLKADFLATISHELRTPLTPIQGFLQTLLRHDVSFDEEEKRRFYEVMLRQSERLERLVKDLLDATSLQDQDHLFLPEEVDWATDVGHVVDLFRRQEPGRTFLVEVQEHLPRVVADEQRAEQVLSNLIANAIKYSPADEPVRITVEARGSEILTTVADRGPGIAPSDRDRIFERFTRLGDHLTRRVGGAGLGLFIARRLVEGMGGTIKAGAAPEGGAAFTFSLPVYEGVARARD
jgi:PAS domain S-box-containing protein